MVEITQISPIFHLNHNKPYRENKLHLKKNLVRLKHENSVEKKLI